MKDGKKNKKGLIKAMLVSQAAYLLSEYNLKRIQSRSVGKENQFFECDPLLLLQDYYAAR